MIQKVHNYIGLYLEYTLHAYTEFVQHFELRDIAQYPDPPKASLDAAIQRWKLTNATPDNEDVKSNLGQYDTIIKE